MTEYNPHRHNTSTSTGERHSGLSDSERVAHMKLGAASVDVVMDSSGRNPAGHRNAETSQASPEHVAKPTTILEHYPDDSVAKTYLGPQTLRASELVHEILWDPVALDAGPLVVHATGINQKGDLEDRVLFFDGDVMVGSSLDSEGRLGDVKGALVNLDQLHKADPIEIGKPWTSPLGKNVGRINYVKVPYTRGFDPQKAHMHEKGSMSPVTLGRIEVDKYRRKAGLPWEPRVH